MIAKIYILRIADKTPFESPGPDKMCTHIHNVFTMYTTLLKWTKEDIRRMERTHSVNYPVLRQNKRVLLSRRI